MYARIVRASLTAETAQEAVTYFQDTVLPALQQHAGFVLGYCFYAPADHHALMVSVWESEEARLSAETSGLPRSGGQSPERVLREQTHRRLLSSSGLDRLVRPLRF